MEPDFADVENLLVDYLAAQDWSVPAPTVGIVLPVDWQASTSPPHVAVQVDDAQEIYAWERPGALSQTCLVRITAWAQTRDLAKRVCGSARALVMAYPATPSVGVIAGTDPENRAPLATCTVSITQQPD